MSGTPADAAIDTASVRVLVVEDSPEFRELITAQLESSGFRVHAIGDGAEAIEIERAERFDVIVLDLGLPGLDGVEVCRQIRTFSAAYIVMLTGRDDEVDKLIGLSVGADDYMTKPFSVRELTARVNAMLRRPREPEGTTQLRRLRDLVVDPAAREVLVADHRIELTRTEFDLLEALTANPKLVLSRRQLLERVWGPDWYGDDHVVDVHVSSLRRKLGDSADHPKYIRTVRGVGYRLVGRGDERATETGNRSDAERSARR
ncbi:MAG: response regulator transcription factor [Actinomycetota bacterium]